MPWALPGRRRPHLGDGLAQLFLASVSPRRLACGRLVRLLQERRQRRGASLARRERLIGDGRDFFLHVALRRLSCRLAVFERYDLRVSFGEHG
eukprot:1267688-Prymnesium_polylepis.1